MNERTIKYHVGRIDFHNGERTFLRYESYSGVFRSMNEMNPSDGLDDARDANIVVSRLNEMNDIFDGRFYHYRVDNDQNVRRIIGKDAPEEVLKWFRDDEEEPVEEEEEEQVEE